MSSQMLTDLSNALSGQKATATFACGSKSEIDNIFIYYEDKDSKVHKLSFPASHEDVAKLAEACDQATFGLGQVETLDTEYRSAWKLDNSKFLTSFNPQEILDIVKNLLFPPGVGDNPVFVELYKLNIYKGPHDKFKPHVDTPRAKDQFGSLVVCLPCSHQGGQLAIRHGGREVQCDWSGEAKEIQWAAFYSDCEHEVLPVTDGYRLTLTYNLYYGTPKVDDVPTSLPLYQILSEYLKNETFLPAGGVLGMHCYHDYAHAAKSGVERIKHLKGADLALMTVCKALNLEAIALPVFKISRYQHEGYDELEEEDSDDNDEQDDELEEEDSDDNDDQDDETNSYDPLWIFDKPGDGADHLNRSSGLDVVGMGIVSVHDGVGGDYEEGIRHRLDESGNFRMVKGIYWLNRPIHSEVNMAYITYGNEPGQDFMYSAAALFVRIPAYKLR
jgi:hypothetical protein